MFITTVDHFSYECGGFERSVPGVWAFPPAKKASNEGTLKPAIEGCCKKRYNYTSHKSSCNTTLVEAASDGVETIVEVAFNVALSPVFSVAFSAASTVPETANLFHCLHGKRYSLPLSLCPRGHPQTPGLASLALPRGSQ
jgi:hypothetical protein